MTVGRIKEIFLVVVCLIIYATLPAQHLNKKKSSNPVKLSEESLVFDSLGRELSYSLWQYMISSGEYGLKKNQGDSFFVYKLTAEQKETRKASIKKMPKPAESPFFITGEKLYRIKTKDIYGNKIDTKQLKGKILVLNFWFTNCSPCLKEIPELNQIVKEYQNDTNVVFVAIALDEENVLKKFLSTVPFLYKMISNGSFITSGYGIRSYPTNVVIDRESKIHFHTSGFAPNTSIWIRRAIEEIKNKPD